MGTTLFERYQQALRTGHLAAAGDRLTEAAIAFREAIGLAGDRPLPYAALASVQLRMGELDRALETCDEALECDPLYEPALLRRAAALEQLDRGDEAAETWDRVAEARSMQGRLQAACDAVRAAMAHRSTPARRHRVRELEQTLELAMGDADLEVQLGRALGWVRPAEDEVVSPRETARRASAAHAEEAAARDALAVAPGADVLGFTVSGGPNSEAASAEPTPPEVPTRPEVEGPPGATPEGELEPEPALPKVEPAPVEFEPEPAVAETEPELEIPAVAAAEPEPEPELEMPVVAAAEPEPEPELEAEVQAEVQAEAEVLDRSELFVPESAMGAEMAEDSADEAEAVVAAPGDSPGRPSADLSWPAAEPIARDREREKISGGTGLGTRFGIRVRAAKGPVPDWPEADLARQSAKPPPPVPAAAAWPAAEFAARNPAGKPAPPAAAGSATAAEARLVEEPFEQPLDDAAMVGAGDVRRPAPAPEPAGASEPPAAESIVEPDAAVAPRPAGATARPAKAPQVDPESLVIAAEESMARGDVGSSVVASMLAARGFLERDAMNAALDACTSALAVAPAHVDLHLTIADIYLARGWTALAGDAFASLLRLTELDEDVVAHGRIVEAARAGLPGDARFA